VTPEVAKSDCKNRCIARVVGSHRKCESPILDWLDCLTATTMRPEASNRVVDELGGEPRCSIVRQLVEHCEEGCRSEGLLRSGEATVADATGIQTVKYELFDCGCSTCSAEQGAQALAPCQAAKVCADYVFVCDGGVTYKRLRACGDARCAEGAQAATLIEQLLTGRHCSRVIR
jgi:hypothetical protein